MYTRIYYIVYIQSPTYVPTCIYIEIKKDKSKLSPGQLIEVVCGSVAAFFAIIAIVIFVMRKDQLTEISCMSDDSSNIDETDKYVYEVTNDLQKLNVQYFLCIPKLSLLLKIYILYFPVFVSNKFIHINWFSFLHTIQFLLKINNYLFQN